MGRRIEEPVIWEEMDRKDFVAVCHEHRRAVAYLTWREELFDTGSELPKIWEPHVGTRFVHTFSIAPFPFVRPLSANVAASELADALLTYDADAVQGVYGKYLPQIDI